MGKNNALKRRLRSFLLQKRQPSLTDLVDWSEAPEWVKWATLDWDGLILFHQDDPYLRVDKRWESEGSQEPHKRISMFSFPHDWQTPLKRPIYHPFKDEGNHTYTDEEPNAGNNFPSHNHEHEYNAYMRRLASYSNAYYTSMTRMLDYDTNSRHATSQYSQPSSSRQSWDQYFIGLARFVSSRSTCLRRQVGAVAVRDKRILATGYNGAPSGLDHCLDTGCLRQELDIPSGQNHELCRALHAEQNVIIQAAVHGISLAGASLYVTTTPCSICAKMLINCGIITIFVPIGQRYNDDMALEMLAQAQILIKAVTEPADQTKSQAPA